MSLLSLHRQMVNPCMTEDLLKKYPLENFKIKSHEKIHLRWIKQWILGSKRPITSTVKTWLYPRGLEPRLGVMSQGDKDQWKLLYHLHYRETCALTYCTERDFWAIRHYSKLVQGELPVAYQVDLILMRAVSWYMMISVLHFSIK